MPDLTLDTQGQNCPLPILKVKKAITTVPVGGTLEVLASDPGSVDDFVAFCKQAKHEMVEKSEAAGVYRFLLKRTA